MREAFKISDESQTRALTADQNSAQSSMLGEMAIGIARTRGSNVWRCLKIGGAGHGVDTRDTSDSAPAMAVRRRVAQKAEEKGRRTAEEEKGGREAGGRGGKTEGWQLKEAEGESLGPRARLEPAGWIQTVESREEG